MSIQPNIPIYHPPIQNITIAAKKEGFNNEGQKLKELYDEYCKNLGGYQNINGKWVHVHTVLHSDSQVAKMLREMQIRLQSLGLLPQKTSPYAPPFNNK